MTLAMAGSWVAICKMDIQACFQRVRYKAVAHAQRYIWLTSTLVYTTPAPKALASVAPTQAAAYARFPGSLNTSVQAPNHSEVVLTIPVATFDDNERTAPTLPTVNIPKPPFVSPSQSPQIAQSPPVQATYKPQSNNSSMYNRNTSHNSTVINDTLNVIDEHITNMHRPSLDVIGGNERRPSNDSGSQYSSNFGRRPSYVRGGDTDDEDVSISYQEVMGWSPAKVAEYLEKAGVEKSHCEVFQEEEFSGEVLLGLDQSAILLQELRLGSIGRRMKTWQKIRALQDEVKSAQPVQTRSLIGVDTVASSAFAPSRQPSPSALTKEDLNADPVNRMASPMRAQTWSERKEFAPPQFPSPSLGTNSPRPSAASIRSLAHSRRQSSLDGSSTLVANGPFVPEYSSHGKQASFDQGWTMGGNKQPIADHSWNPVARQPLANGLSRPVSSIHLQSYSTDRAQFDRPLSVLDDPDRAYSSGGELDIKRQRNVVQKQEPEPPTAVAGRPTERKRASTLFWRGSGPPSPIKKSDAGAVSQLHSSIRIVSEPVSSTIPPTVTKLAYGSETPRGDRVFDLSGASSEIQNTDHNQAPTESAGRKGFRAISDAITGREKAYVQQPASENNTPIDSSLPDTPTLAGSSDPSITSKDIDLEDANKSEFSTSTQAQSTAAARRKSKKSTSAYTRGLEKKPYHEQTAGCDYSGWMKKKSSNLMTTWKPRLFVLHGRRLSYYYSENDREEKGLIDISNHRVLPADNDFITGLHATLTGAISVNTNSQPGSSSPTSKGLAKSNSSTPTSMTADSPLAPGVSRASSFSPRDNPAPLKGDNQPFIFKLVPPRTGLSKAVNFTKPTVHYFAVPTLQEGRLWMAALMKATIDRDESKKVVTTYQQKTISLEKARARRERPPGLKDVNEQAEDDEDADAVAGAQEGDVGANGNGEAYGGPVGAVTGAGRMDTSEPTALQGHLQGQPQSMSFVSSLERQAAEADGSNTATGTPSTGGGGYRKWSFGSSTKESVSRDGSQGAGVVEPEVSAQGLGIHGVSRDVGTW